MCVAVPGRVEWIGTPTTASIPARIETGGHCHDVDLVMVPDATIGDFVIAHSGYALRVVAPDQAAETRRLLGLDH